MKKVNLKIISSIPPHGFSRRIIVLIAASVPKVFSEKKSHSYHRIGLINGQSERPKWGLRTEGKNSKNVAFIFLRNELFFLF